MKKLLFTLLACLLVMPAMAFYVEGKRVELTVRDEAARLGETKTVTVKCEEMRNAGPLFSSQKCESKDGLTMLVTTQRVGSAYKNEKPELESDKKEFKKGNKASKKFSCDEADDSDYVTLTKGLIAKDSGDPHAGFVAESLIRHIDRNGTISITRYYDPEDEKMSDNQKEYLKNHMKDMVLFDVRESQEDTDIARLCEMNFPLH